MNHRQHFVPQIYLKQFTPDEGGFFFQAIPGKARIESVHIHKVCYATDFYNLSNVEILKKHGIDDPEYLERYGFPYENRTLAFRKNFENLDFLANMLDNVIASVKEEDNSHHITFG